MLLNQKAVERIKKTANRQQIMDDTLRGFGVRVEPDGRKSFLWTARIQGKLRFRFLGEYPIVTLNQARMEAEKLNGQAAAWKSTGYQDPDPFELKPKPKREASTVPTFRELIEAYIARHVKLNANHPERAIYDVNWQVKRHFEKWQDRRIDQITLADMLAVKNACGDKHHLANRAVEFIKALYNWSCKNREGKINFWEVDNPAKHVEFYEETKRERFLQPEELVRLNAAMEKEPSQDLKDFIVLALESGARKGNVFGMRWCDLHWERKIWSIPAGQSKNGVGYDVALEPVALDVLKRRRAEIPDSSEFVFPGPGKTGHLIELKKPWQALKKRAGIEDLHVHDLRRTMASYQAIAGESLQKIAVSLGHKSLQSTLIYAKLQDQGARETRASGKAVMQQLVNEAKRNAKKLAARKPKLLKMANAS